MCYKIKMKIVNRGVRVLLEVFITCEISLVYFFSRLMKMINNEGNEYVSKYKNHGKFKKFQLKSQFLISSFFNT